MPEVLDVARKHGADLNTVLDETDVHALHEAVRANHVAIVEYLVKSGIDINRPAPYPAFKPVIEEAARLKPTQRTRMQQYLLRLGADPRTDVGWVRKLTSGLITLVRHPGSAG